MPQRYFIELSYNGTAYHGWQVQPNAKTIQESLNEALSTVLRQEIYCVGCGRTDTGVHAHHFVAHFESEKEIGALEDFTYRLNRILPSDIAISMTYPVAADTHSRFSAEHRTYRYYITQQKNPFAVNRKWEFRIPLDLNKMNEAAKLLLGEKDFSCFSKSNTQTETNFCNVTHAFWTHEEQTLCFEIKANRFLRNMVRAVVGTLIEVGQGNITIADVSAILESKDRREAGTSVPAHGLYLWHVAYPANLINEREKR